MTGQTGALHMTRSLQNLFLKLHSWRQFCLLHHHQNLLWKQMWCLYYRKAPTQGFGSLGQLLVWSGGLCSLFFQLLGGRFSGNIATASYGLVGVWQSRKCNVVIEPHRCCGRALGAKPCTLSSACCENSALVQQHQRGEFPSDKLEWQRLGWTGSRHRWTSWGGMHEFSVQKREHQPVFMASTCRLLSGAIHCISVRSTFALCRRCF